MQNDSLSISEAVDGVFLPPKLDVSHILRVFAPFSTFECIQLVLYYTARDIFIKSARALHDFLEHLMIRFPRVFHVWYGINVAAIFTLFKFTARF